MLECLSLTVFLLDDSEGDEEGSSDVDSSMLSMEMESPGRRKEKYDAEDDVFDVEFEEDMDMLVLYVWPRI